MSSLSSLRLLRVGLALAVAFWMAGAGCMLGCVNMVEAASLHDTNAASDQAVISGDACASAQSHHCCANHRARSQSRAGTQTTAAPTDTVELIGNSAPSMIDCPLALNATAAISKPGSDHSTVAAVTTNASDLVPHLSAQERALSHPLLLPNRGHTYLRCCVFLI